MYLNHVEAFINVVKFKSFSKAAKELYLSQPTISSYIKSLESELGVQLIVRSTRDVVLSEAGVVFYEYAVKLIRIRDTAYNKMQNYMTDITGTLPLAASPVPAQYLVPKLIADIHQDQPSIFFSIKEMGSQEVINKIDDYKYELGITCLKSSNSQCVFETLGEDPIVLITPNTEHYRSMNGDFHLDDLKKDPFIIREDGSSTRNKTIAFLKSKKISLTDLNIISEMQTVESVKHAVSENLGISFISKRAALDYIKFGYVLAFEFDSKHLNNIFYLVYHKNRMLSPVAEYVYNYLKRNQISSNSNLPRE